jgi:hypothetical protein
MLASPITIAWSCACSVLIFVIAATTKILECVPLKYWSVIPAVHALLSCVSSATQHYCKQLCIGLTMLD